jgi:hypothetical protein
MLYFLQDVLHTCQVQSVGSNGGVRGHCSKFQLLTVNLAQWVVS